MSHEGLLTTEQRIEGLQEEIAFQSAEPQGSDMRIAACNQALQEIFVPDSQLYRICMNAFERRPDLNPIHANRLMVRAFQRHALRYADSINFPARHDEREPWADLQQLVLKDVHMRRRFRRDMYENSVQTNFDERGKSLKLVALLMPERFNRPLRILELGSGPNHILKKLALNSYGAGFHFDPVMVKRSEVATDTGSGGTENDEFTSAKLNTLLSTGRIAVRKFLGIDKDAFKKPSSIEWLRSQFYTSEYEDPGFLEKFDLVQASRPLRVQFRQINIFELARSPVLMKQILQGGRFDFVLYGTFMYQMTREGIETSEWVGNQLVDPENGIKVYQDAINVDPQRPNEIQVVKHWSPYTWRTIIEDMRNPGKKQTLFVWKNGRCHEVQIGDAELCVDDSLVKAGELLAA